MMNASPASASLFWANTSQARRYMLRGLVTGMMPSSASLAEAICVCGIDISTSP